ncbi:MAG TPA: flavin reductase family protein [Burkholderiales bacterium]|nr:flavin reductase family protein [Burkholderiales bacterium]
MWEEPDALPRPELDARDFRSALGRFPTGVCLVTTLGSGGRPAGMTVNSFTSVSLDPPMVLWSLSREASSAPVFREAEYFAVNVLAACDAEIASHFAMQGPDKFAAYAARFAPGIGAVPVLQGAAATFECHTRHRNYGGDHIILIGAVERYAHTDRPPLVFHRGKYAALP